MHETTEDIERLERLMEASSIASNIRLRSPTTGWRKC
jgi:hypothetical protein